MTTITLEHPNLVDAAERIQRAISMTLLTKVENVYLSQEKCTMKFKATREQADGIRMMIELMGVVTTIEQ